MTGRFKIQNTNPVTQDDFSVFDFRISIFEFRISAFDFRLHSLLDRSLEHQSIGHDLLAGLQARGDFLRLVVTL
jgi:hypothetical protein